MTWVMDRKLRSDKYIVKPYLLIHDSNPRLGLKPRINLNRTDFNLNFNQLTHPHMIRGGEMKKDELSLLNCHLYQVWNSIYVI